MEDACIDADDLVAFLHARLAPPGVRALERHVARCDECRALLSALAERESAVAAVATVGPRDADSRASTTPLVRGAPDPVLAPGTRIGRYVVLARLGAGGMGVVYSAHDPELDRQVALKLLRGDAFGRERLEPLGEQLRQEAQAMARLAHPNVVAVHDVGRFGEQLFIAMELVDGVTLATWLAAAPRTWSAIVASFRQAGLGLAAAHAAGLVHRDFKPENVLIGTDGRARVSDFGLARASSASAEAEALSAAGDALRYTGLVAGTPFYMAPEQFLGPAVDHRTDQFSFCVALSWALTGVHPFDGEGAEGLARAVTEGRLRPPPRPDPVPGWLRRVLERGLAVDPDARFPSMDALLAALARNPRRRLALVAGALAALVVAGLGGVLAYRQGRAAPALLCRGGERHWDGVWDGARRARLEQVFLASKQPGASASFAEVRGHLDGYARDWTRMQREACEATRVRGEQPEELLQKRMVCLDARLRDARALVGRLASADAALVEKAPRALAMLGDLGACADVQALASQVPLPTSPEVRARVGELRGQLAEAKATRVAMGPAQGEPAARAVVAGAHALAYRPLEAEALLELEACQSEAADFAGAAATLEQAVWAAEAGRADELEARAWIRLMIARRLAGGRAVDALALRPRVTALLERMGGNPAVEGLFRAVLAKLLLATDQFDAARVEAQAGLSLLEKQHGADDPDIAYATDALGAIAVDEGRVLEGLADLERSLRLRRAQLGASHPLVLTSLAHTGYALVKAGRDAEAIALLEQSLPLLERRVGAAHPDVGDVLYHLGFAYQHVGDVEHALALYRRAATSTPPGAGSEGAGVGDFLTAEGYALMELGRATEAKAALTRAIATFEVSEGPDNTSCAFPLRHLAELEISLGEWDAARTNAGRAVAIWEKALGPTSSRLTDGLILLGLVEVESRHPARAVPVLERTLSLMTDADARERAQARFLLAEALVSSGGDAARAVTLARSARESMAADPSQAANLSEVEAWLAKHETHRTATRR